MTSTCGKCNGTKKALDPTMANWVGNNGSGLVDCYHCSKTGTCTAKNCYMGCGRNPEEMCQKHGGVFELDNCPCCGTAQRRMGR